MEEIKVPRAIVRGGGKALDKARESGGDWVLFKEMNGTSALQTARKYNTSIGGAEFEFGVDDDGNLLVRFVG